MDVEDSRESKLAAVRKVVDLGLSCVSGGP